MPLPNDATIWPDALDASEVLDYVMELSDLLDVANQEAVEDYTLAMSDMGAALGVRIRSDGLYAPTLLAGNRDIRLWFSVDPASHAAPGFDGAGVVVGITVHITTNTVPARQRERTYGLVVRQR